MKTTIIYLDDDGKHTLLLPNWVVKHVLAGLVKKGKIIHEQPEPYRKIERRRTKDAIPMQDQQRVKEYRV